MNEVDKIRYKTKMQEEWLREYNRLIKMTRIAESPELLIAYTYEGMGVDGYPTEYVQEVLNNETRLKLLNILIEEFREFEAKGFEKWLQEQEEKEGK